MNYEKKVPENIFKIFETEKVKLYGISYYAFPKAFNSTAGPRGGVGGCSVSTFTVEAYVGNNEGPTVYVCAGMYYFEDKPFKPFKVNTDRVWMVLAG